VKNETAFEMAASQVRFGPGVLQDHCKRSRQSEHLIKAAQILEIFSRGWPLEVCFRDVKQFLGFEDPQNRAARATTRTAPLVFFIYDLVLLWYAQSGHRLAPKSTLERLWYPPKTSVSFEDILSYFLAQK
jgi:hypothetical protein